jgi:hypothetical protein
MGTAQPNFNLARRRPHADERQFQVLGLNTPEDGAPAVLPGHCLHRHHAG